MTKGKTWEKVRENDQNFINLKGNERNAINVNT